VIFFGVKWCESFPDCLIPIYLYEALMLYDKLYGFWQYSLHTQRKFESEVLSSADEVKVICPEFLVVLFKFAGRFIIKSFFAHMKWEINCKIWSHWHMGCLKTRIVFECCTMSSCNWAAWVLKCEMSSYKFGMFICFSAMLRDLYTLSFANASCNLEKI
jgi:hypothetical protein